MKANTGPTGALRGKAKSGCLARESVMRGSQQSKSVASDSSGVTRQQRRRLLVIEDICSQRVFGAGTFAASPRRRLFGQPVLLAEWRLVSAGYHWRGHAVPGTCAPTPHAGDSRSAPPVQSGPGRKGASTPSESDSHRASA